MAAKRKVFEDVTAAAAPAPRGGLIDRGTGGSRPAVRIWLILLFVLVVAMILVGGLTRLTDSGLSITRWDPIGGALPPLSEADWQSEFAAYQQTDEFRLQNSRMTMEEFRYIFWWEWAHRQLGRFVGLVWAAGFLWFLARRQIPQGWTGRLLGLGVLGGAQGAIGWWMVKSGLGNGMTDVASYRLAIHLGLAFAILGLIAWYVFRLSRSEALLLQARRIREVRLHRYATGLAALVFVQILLGALVAGIDAGRGFTDWPLMAGEFLPPDPLALEPVWRNFFENAGTVQFVHRMMGYLVLVVGIAAWLRGRRSVHRRTQAAFNMMVAMLLVQILIGVATVMYSAPLALALVHQLGAVALWVMVLRARFLSHYPVSISIRGA